MTAPQPVVEHEETTAQEYTYIEGTDLRRNKFLSFIAK